VTNGPNGITGELTVDEQVVAEQLDAARPVPPAAFRGALGRRLAELDLRYGCRPQRLRLIVSGYLGAGTLLLAIGALQAIGAL